MQIQYERSHLNWLVCEVQKPIGSWREEIRVKLAAGQALYCAHLASLADIQGNVMAQAKKKKGGIMG